MRPVYAVSGGVSKFAKARPDKTFQAVVKEAYDYAIADLGLDFPGFTSLVDGSVASYFSDHFTRQLMAGHHGPGLPGTDPQARPPGRGRRRHGRASASRRPGSRSPAATWTSAWPTASRP